MKSLQTFALALLAMGSMTAAQAATPSISVLPSAQTIASGETFSVDVVIDNLTGSTGLGGYDFTLTFNNALIDLVNVQFGDKLSYTGPSLQSILQSSGSVNVVEISLDPTDTLVASQPASFGLLNLSFVATAAGTSALNISVNSVADAFGEALAPTTVNGSVAISSVPEPTAYLMFCAGLMTLIGARAQAQKSRKA